MATERVKPVGAFNEIDNYRTDYTFPCELTPSKRGVAGDEWKAGTITADGKVKLSTTTEGGSDIVHGLIGNIAPSGKYCRFQLHGVMTFEHEGLEAEIGAIISLIGSATPGKVDEGREGDRRWLVLDLTDTTITVVPV